VGLSIIFGITKYLGILQLWGYQITVLLPISMARPIRAFILLFALLASTAQVSVVGAVGPACLTGPGPCGSMQLLPLVHVRSPRIVRLKQTLTSLMLLPIISC
jgi:hypothetical protein